MPNKDSSWKNVKDWAKGKAKLQNAVLQHPEEGSTPSSSIYNFIKSKKDNNKVNILNFDQYKKLGKS
jgi:thiamine kinase-like enzyme|tara:strand:- start:714 stop:914 length:201 start_codon:yes stop_codon:yes gene_type:complete